MRRSRKWKAVGLALTALGCGALVWSVGVASARWDVFRAGDVILKFDGGVTPRALPRFEPAPLGVQGRIQIAMADGSHPPAFRSGVFEGDRDIVLDATGLPTCRGGRLEARDTRGARRACGDAIVGSGSGTVEIAFAEQAPILVESPLTFFNGGVKGNTTTLYVHAFITVPVPAAIVTTVRLEELRRGPYGLRIESEVPVIAGGSGSIVAARFNLGRRFVVAGERHSYLSGKCPDGRFRLRIVRTEFEVPGTGHAALPLSGELARPCTPR